MRCTKLVLTVVGLMIVMLVVLAAPAMADDGRHHRDGKQDHHNKKHDHDKRFFDDHDKKFFDDHDKRFFDPDFVEVDVDFDKVGRHSAWLGNCFVTDIDGNRWQILDCELLDLTSRRVSDRYF